MNTLISTTTKLSSVAFSAVMVMVTMGGTVNLFESQQQALPSVELAQVVVVGHRATVLPSVTVVGYRNATPGALKAFTV